MISPRFANGTTLLAGLYTSGTEPDPRFDLANERTFLAGASTSPALPATESRSFAQAESAVPQASTPGQRAATAGVPSR